MSGVFHRVPVDLSHLRSLFDNDPATEQKLFNVFLRQASELLHMLEVSCGENQMNEWRQAAHKLKGSSANLGAHALSDLCNKAEHSYAAPKSEKQKSIDDIQKELASVKAFLSDITFS